ncbi:MAG: hypothetical protein HY318_16920 [Armatimonadetes bacterium]|nr:hypothetical protein [Armatimonadota bacterium]
MTYKAFESDPVMHTLHERQAEYAAKVKDMAPEEELAFFRKNLHDRPERNGWTLVSVKPGVMRLQKAPQGGRYTQTRDPALQRSARKRKHGRGAVETSSKGLQGSQ